MEEVVDDGWGRHRADDEVRDNHAIEQNHDDILAYNAVLIFDKFQDHNDEPMENPQEVITECLSKFCTPDYIMEPGIFTQLKR